MDREIIFSKIYKISFGFELKTLKRLNQCLKTQSEAIQRTPLEKIGSRLQLLMGACWCQWVYFNVTGMFRVL
jgi:hypothetical protein